MSKMSKKIREENCVFDVPDDDTIAFGVRLRGMSVLEPKWNRPTYEGVFEDDDDCEKEDRYYYKLSDAQRREFWEEIVEEDIKFLKKEAKAQKQMEAWMKATNYVEPTYEQILERYRAKGELMW